MTITAVLHVHITIMKKIPLRMIWFDCTCFDKQMLQCTRINSQPSENDVLIQAAVWTKQENRIRLVVWNRNSIDSKERQIRLLTVISIMDM